MARSNTLTTSNPRCWKTAGTGTWRGVNPADERCKSRLTVPVDSGADARGEQRTPESRGATAAFDEPRTDVCVLETCASLCRRVAATSSPRSVGVVVTQPGSMRHALELRDAFLRDGACASEWHVDLIAPSACPVQDSPTQRWHTIVVPPIERWVGLHVDPVHDWVVSITRSAHRVVGVGTGTFVLALAGLIDGRAVVAAPWYAAYLAALTPTCVVHLGHTAMRDGHVNTATNCGAGIALCEALASEDCSLPIDASSVCNCGSSPACAG